MTNFIDAVATAVADEQRPQGASSRTTARAVTKAATRALVESNGLQFVHIRNWNVTDYGWNTTTEVDPKGGMTIAYKILRSGGDIVELATALCHSKDHYDKVMGKFYAAQNFSDGKTIRIKLPESTRYGQHLRRIFGAELV